MTSSSVRADARPSSTDDWYALPGDVVAAEFGVDPTVGLAGDDARRRLAEHGPNRLAEPERRSALRRFIDQFASPLVAVLAGAAVLAAASVDESMLTGESSPPTSAPTRSTPRTRRSATASTSSS